MKDLIRMSVLGIGLLLVAAGCAQTMPAGTTTTTLPSSTGQPVVMTSPAQPGSGAVGAGVVRHNFTGEITDVDRNSGKVMSGETFHSAPGPAADECTRARYRKDASPERMA